jgi:hypothetical protein
VNATFIYIKLVNATLATEWEVVKRYPMTKVLIVTLVINLKLVNVDMLEI